ncbi:hypothetical protein B0T14DRAFT_569415 [Immersiella caudata]|uniref:Tetraspanin n=1 Tax=Immersiella caudata TaxID=314043 RepID=A0AA40BTS1_9PEZI|nr:hypothetical protein B0T14DRAFT_569415 [Immersiella caudata]
MASLIIAIYPLLILALTGIAIYTHQHLTSLSLPVSHILTILPVILPILTLLLTLSLPNLLSPSKPSSRSPPRSPFHSILPTLLTTFHLILTTTLATLLLSSGIPSPVRDCLLELKWKSLWTGHDAESIRKIQDMLNCCGFRTVKDMAWPFPSGPPGSGSGSESCVSRYPGRTEACKGPWGEAMGSGAGWDGAVVVVAGLVQILGLVLGKRFVDGWEGSVWGKLGRWLTAFMSGRGGEDVAFDRGEGSRPLLTGGGSGYVEQEEPEGREGDDDGEEGYRYGTGLERQV